MLDECQKNYRHAAVFRMLWDNKIVTVFNLEKWPEHSELRKTTHNKRKSVTNKSKLVRTS